MQVSSTAPAASYKDIKNVQMSSDLCIFYYSFFFLFFFFTFNLSFCLDAREVEGAMYYRYCLKMHRDASFKALLPLHRLFLDAVVSYAVPDKRYTPTRV